MRIAIIGATGMVGRELINILEDRAFKLTSLQLFASSNSAGESIEFNGDSIVVEELTSADQVKADIAFFAAGSYISKQFVEALAERGITCIDKSSAYRLRRDVPLIVPEVNGHLVKGGHKIIASPNCIATPLAQVLAPLHRAYSLKQVVVSTYQAVSGAGKRGFDELEEQVRQLFNMREPENMPVFGKRIAFNVLPFIPGSSAVDELYKTDEESKVIAEVRKILDEEELPLEVTCVRVPVFNGHSMSVSLAFDKPIKIDDALDTLAKAPGIILIDNPGLQSYPTPLDACGKDLTLVGRIRPNTSTPFGLSCWIASDNLRTGAALNAVRIAETIMLE